VSVPLERYLKSKFGLTLEGTAKLAATDSYFFCKGVCGFHRLTETHKRMCTFLDGTELAKGIIAPRATGKSSIIKGKLIQHIVEDPNVRILYVSKTKDRAEQGVKDMRNRIVGVGAPLLPLLFPQIVPTSLGSVRWTAAAFEVNRTTSWDEATVEAAGVGTNKTGFHYDIIFFDDPLAPDKDDIRAEDIYFNPEVVSKTVGYMQLTSIGNIDSGSKLQLIYFAGTRYSINDAIAWLKKNWKHMAFFEQIIYEDGTEKTAFPTFWDDARILREKENNGSFFFRAQMLNDPVDPATKVFHINRIQEYKTAPKFREGFLTITVDPASGKRGKGHSKTAIMACLAPAIGGVYVLDYIEDYLNQRDTVDKTLKMARKYDPDIVGFEAVGYQAQLEPYLREAMRMEKTRFLIEPIHRSRTAKDGRIMKIQPVLENQELYVKSWMSRLLLCLDDFPHGDKDLLDTLADHIELAYKYSGKLAFKLRKQNIQDSIIESSEIPKDGEVFACVYLERLDDGIYGFILQALKTKGKTYILDAFGVGGSSEPWMHNVMKIPQSTPIITTPDIADTFFSDVENRVIKRKLKSAFPAEAAIQAVDEGSIVLTRGAQALTASSTEAGLKAVQLLAENSRSHAIRAVMV